MFDILMRDGGGAGVPVPLAGRGLVFLGTDGLLRCKASNGDVFQLTAGPQGVQGVPGAAGANGAAGAPGAAGAAGAKGDTGAQGVQGVAGVAGAPGAAGAAGAKGDTGVAGAAGAAGAKGDTGAQGPQGVQGLPGVAGAAGAKGDTGAQGVQGLPGVAGAAGAAGAKGDTGAQGLPGVAGAAGATGPQGLQGPQGVAGASGVGKAGTKSSGAGPVVTAAGLDVLSETVTVGDPVRLTFMMAGLVTNGTTAGSIRGTVLRNGTLMMLMTLALPTVAKVDRPWFFSLEGVQVGALMVWRAVMEADQIALGASRIFYANVMDTTNNTYRAGVDVWSVRFDVVTAAGVSGSVKSAVSRLAVGLG